MGYVHVSIGKVKKGQQSWHNNYWVEADNIRLERHRVPERDQGHCRVEAAGRFRVNKTKE